MGNVISDVAETMGMHSNLVWVLVAMLGALLIGTVLRVGRYVMPSSDPAKVRQRLASLLTWSALYLVLTGMLIGGRLAVAAVFAVVSLVALREYSRLTGARVADRRLWWWAALAIPIQYGIVVAGSLGAFWTFIPVWVLAILLIQLVVAEETQGFLENAGIVFLGLMLLVYLLSHAALVVALPLVPPDDGAGALGAFLYLVALTETNDIAQALWGRRFGRHKITPHVSPHKTWEGFMLGGFTTVVLAIALAPLLTPLAERALVMGYWRAAVPYLPAGLAGALIAVAGFFGDVTISAIKREIGVKDSGTLLPGMGGILDRIDSLTFTAPAFFYFIYVFCA